jgi:hypothetical protein
MRHLVLLSFFICLFLHFQSSYNEAQESDTLSTQQSALTKPTIKAAKLPKITAILEKNPKIKTVKSDKQVAANDYQDYEEDDLSQLPWDDIEEGWKTQLKEFLVSVDPEKADDMFAAYLEEKKKYVERIDFSDQDTAPDAFVEHDGNQGEVERLHAENLKDIFGVHYSQVEFLHRDYVDSVQYLNRTTVKFTISL